MERLKARRRVLAVLSLPHVLQFEQFFTIFAYPLLQFLPFVLFFQFQAVLQVVASTVFTIASGYKHQEAHDPWIQRQLALVWLLL